MIKTIEKEWFLESLKNKEIIEKLKKIKLIVTDIDGSLTNGELFIADSKSPIDNKSIKCLGKSFCIKDGYAISNIIKNNKLILAFLTGRTDEATKIRAKMLGIPEELCFVGINHKKIDKIKLLQQQNNYSKEETLYFGDDFLDFETLSAINIMVCPKNTPFYFKEKSDLIIPHNGGNSAFRLLLDLILYVQNKHFAQEFIEASINS